MALCAALGLSLVAGDATAAPPVEAKAEAEALTDKAGQLYDEGVALYKKGQYAAARASLLAAWALKQHWQIAGNLADCEVQMGRYREAAEHASYYLRHAPANRREKAEALLKTATGKVATVTLRVEPAGAEVLVDGKAVGRAPFEGALFLEPGERVITARVPGRQDAEEKRTLVAGGTAEVLLAVPERVPTSPEAAVVPPPAVPPSASPRQDEQLPAQREVVDGPAWRIPVMIAGAGAALVGIGVGIGFTVASSSAASDADALLGDLQARGGPSPCVGGQFASECATLAEHNRDSDTLLNVGIAGFVISGVAAGAAVAAFLWPVKQSTRPTASVVPAVGPDGGGLVVRGAF